MSLSNITSLMNKTFCFSCTGHVSLLKLDSKPMFVAIVFEDQPTNCNMNILGGFPVVHQLCCVRDCYDNSWPFNWNNVVSICFSLHVWQSFCFQPWGNSLQSVRQCLLLVVWLMEDSSGISLPSERARITSAISNLLRSLLSHVCFVYAKPLPLWAGVPNNHTTLFFWIICFTLGLKVRG